MSPLAEAIYQVLRTRVPKPIARRALIGYTELIAELYRYPDAPTDLDHHGDGRIDAALGEITRACRAEKLPVISALLTLDATHRPPAAYFAAAHPEATGEEAQVAGWEQELREVAITFYPQKLAALVG